MELVLYSVSQSDGVIIRLELKNNKYFQNTFSPILWRASFVFVNVMPRS